MTEERPEGEGEAGASTDTERDARLAALLSVDIGLPARSRPGGGVEPDETFRAFVAPSTQPDGDEPSAPVESPAMAAAPAPVEPEPAPVDPEPAETTTDVEARQPTSECEVAPAPATGRDLRTALSFAVLAVLLLGGVGLTYAGTRIVRSSTQGEVVSQDAEPGEPGYEALVEATPTFALFHEVDGLVDSITVLTLPDPDGTGGGVIFVPTRTVVEMPLFDVAPVEVAYDLADDRFGAEALGLLLTTAIEGRTILDDERWADLVAPVAPLTIDNPNELRIDDAVRFPTGEIQLEAADVGPYLSSRIEGESDLARLFRHRLLWEAWLAAVGAAGTPEAVPGELDTGIGRFVRALATGDAILETLPVDPALPESYGPEPAFLPDAEGLQDLVYRLVPFPVAPAPGYRARVRVLNGTDDTAKATAVASDLTPIGVEIVLIGNALSLDEEQTTVRYFGAEFRDEAEDIVDFLGVGEVREETRPSDAVDITVTLGADHE